MQTKTLLTMATLESVDAFPVPDLLIPRIAKQHGHTLEVAEVLLREAKRMLYLSAAFHIPVSPSLIVDDAWHEMLMFTRFYRKFADHIGGFIHHDPTPGVPDGGAGYRATKKNYKEKLGVMPEPAWWP